MPGGVSPAGAEQQAQAHRTLELLPRWRATWRRAVEESQQEEPETPHQKG